MIDFLIQISILNWILWTLNRRLCINVWNTLHRRLLRWFSGKGVLFLFNNLSSNPAGIYFCFSWKEMTKKISKEFDNFCHVCAFKSHLMRRVVCTAFGVKEPWDEKVQLLFVLKLFQSYFYSPNLVRFTCLDLFKMLFLVLSHQLMKSMID